MHGFLFFGKDPLEPVVPNVLKFVILLPGIDLANSSQVLDILDVLSMLQNLDEILFWLHFALVQAGFLT